MCHESEILFLQPTGGQREWEEGEWIWHHGDFKGEPPKNKIGGKSLLPIMTSTGQFFWTDFLTSFSPHHHYITANFQTSESSPPAPTWCGHGPRTAPTEANIQATLLPAGTNPTTIDRGLRDS